MIEPCKTYLDIWGEPRYIAGFVRFGNPSQPPKRSTEIVYSTSGTWYYVETGRGYNHTPDLVDDLSIPTVDAIKLWNERIREIKEANDGRTAHLHMISNMQDRIRWLQTEQTEP